MEEEKRLTTDELLKLLFKERSLEQFLQRNESAYITHVIERMATAYGVSADEVCRRTTATVRRIFSKAFEGEE